MRRSDNYGNSGDSTVKYNWSLSYEVECLRRMCQSQPTSSNVKRNGGPDVLFATTTTEQPTTYNQLVLNCGGTLIETSQPPTKRSKITTIQAPRPQDFDALTLQNSVHKPRNLKSQLEASPSSPHDLQIFPLKPPTHRPPKLSWHPQTSQP